MSLFTPNVVDRSINGVRPDDLTYHPLINGFRSDEISFLIRKERRAKRYSLRLQYASSHSSQKSQQGYAFDRRRRMRRAHGAEIRKRGVSSQK